MNGLSGRLPLVALFLTVVAALSIACGQEAAVLRAGGTAAIFGYGRTL